MVNIEINLAVSGVTTIPIANTETEVILHVWYDGNDTFYHNIHRVFLVNENDILTCQVWFQQIGQVETEAELLLQDAIKVINIAPNSKKTLLILTVDKAKIGGARFFAEAVSGNSEIDTSSFVTQDSLSQTVNQIYDDLSLTAERIVQNATNPDTSTSTIELTNDRASFFVQTNTVDFIVDEVYADWEYIIGTTTSLTTTTGLNMVDQVGTLSAEQIASLFADYPRPEYQLYPFHDLNLTNLSFYVMRNMEAYWLNVTEFLLTAYTDRFGLILDTSILGSEFVKIQLTNLNIISGSPNANNATFPLTSVGTTARPTVKYPYGTFKIWKDNNLSRNNIIFTIPLTNTRFQSTKTTNNLDTLNFWINNEGWYFGTKAERNELFSPITKSYDVDIASVFITLEDGMDDTIVPISFARMNPSFGPTIPLANGTLSFNNGNLVEEINFKLRLVVSGVPSGSLIIIRQNTTPIFTYLTLNTDTAQPNVVTLLVRANNALITIVPIVEIKNQDYHDWAFVSGNSTLSVAQIMKTPAKVLTTTQYNSFNPDNNIRLNVVAVADAPIFLSSLSFYWLRDNYTTFNSSGTAVYTTSSYDSRVIITLNCTALNANWILFTFDNLLFQTAIPIGNKLMFPASTSSTTNYTPPNNIQRFGASPSLQFTGTSTAMNPFVFNRGGQTDLSSKTFFSGKIWIRTNGSVLEFFQGSQAEIQSLVYVINSSSTFNKQIDLSDADKILYPIRTVSDYSIPTTISPHLPYSAIPRNFTFRVRLHYSYQGGLYFSQSQGNYSFNAQIEAFVQLTPSGAFVSTDRTYRFTRFPMSQPQVTDLVFRVANNSMTLEGTQEMIL
jgi:hypothetical protein